MKIEFTDEQRDVLFAELNEWEWAEKPEPFHAVLLKILQDCVGSKVIDKVIAERASVPMPHPMPDTPETVKLDGDEPCEQCKFFKGTPKGICWGCQLRADRSKRESEISDILAQRRAGGEE